MSMEALSLNSSFGSLVDETFFGPMDDEDTLLRRLSPYATLRPGDLTSLLGIQLHSPDANRHKPITGFFADAIVEASEGSTSSGSDDEAEQKSSDEEEAVIVRGQDIGDLPAEYVVRGLRPQEMPVIGVYIDPRIMPGFRYRVRRLRSDKYLFDGQALVLQSIGLGFAKRITFEGNSYNFNDNYFWSDSDPNGFAFALEAVRPGDQLSIIDGNGSLVGEVKVESVPFLQEELSSKVVNGDVIKHVHVTLKCSVTYHQRHHGTVNLMVQDVETLSGVAQVIKRKGTRVAALDCISDVTCNCIRGPCTLLVEP